MTTLYRVLVTDKENNHADIIVSAGTTREARSIAVKAADEELGGKYLETKWHVDSYRDAVTLIELDPPRYHAVVKGWD